MKDNGKMASLDSVPVSITEAKECLYDWITKPNEEKEKLQVIKEILNKHPDLINCEYKHQTGFYGTPLLLALQQHDISYGKLLNS